MREVEEQTRVMVVMEGRLLNQIVPDSESSLNLNGQIRVRPTG